MTLLMPPNSQTDPRVHAYQPRSHRCHAHKTQMLSSELVDGLLALNVSTLDDAKALSVEKLLTLPGLSKKGAAQKLKDRLGEILPCGYYNTYVT